MKVIEINKYPPDVFDRGNFLRDDWSSYSDIGSVFSGRVVTREDFLEVEDRYVRAVFRFAKAALAEASLYAHALEFWNEKDESLERFGLAGVLDGAHPPVESEPLAGARLENAIRRCMRETAWLELMVPKRFLVHFGYDLRVFIATTSDTEAESKATTGDGLYVYSARPNLNTLIQWGSVEQQVDKGS